MHEGEAAVLSPSSHGDVHARDDLDPGKERTAGRSRKIDDPAQHAVDAEAYPHVAGVLLDVVVALARLEGRSNDVFENSHDRSTSGITIFLYLGMQAIIRGTGQLQRERLQSLVVGVDVGEGIGVGGSRRTSVLVGRGRSSAGDPPDSSCQAARSSLSVSPSWSRSPRE